MIYAVLWVLSECLKVHRWGLCSKVTEPNLPISLWITFIGPHVCGPALQIVPFCTDLDTETPLLIYFLWFLIFLLGTPPGEKDANIIQLVNSIKQTVSLSSLGFLRRLSTVSLFHFPFSPPRWQLGSGGGSSIQTHHSFCLLSPIPGHWSPYLASTLQTWAWETISLSQLGLMRSNLQLQFYLLSSWATLPLLTVTLPQSCLYPSPSPTTHTPLTWPCSCPHCFGKNHSVRFPPGKKEDCSSFTSALTLPKISLHSTLWPRQSPSDAFCITIGSLCLCYLLLPTRIGSSFSLWFCPQSKESCPQSKEFQMEPTLPFLVAFELKVQVWKRRKKILWDKTKILYHFPKCDFLMSIFSDAEFFNSFLELLHQLLAP